MRWLSRAFTVSTFGSMLALDAFPLIAVVVLHASATQVSGLAALGALAALAAVPLGPWVEFRRKRPVLVGADLVRCAVLGSVVVAAVVGVLSFAHLVVAAVAVAVTAVAAGAASGAHLRALVPPDRLAAVGGRFEQVTWLSTALGPPLGGALVGVLGQAVTAAVDATSYLLSALCLRAIRTPEPVPARSSGSRLADLVRGWRVIGADPELRTLLANNALVAALIMATAPLMAHLMLGELGFSAFAYGLAFGLPCLGGSIGARLSRRLDPDRVLRVAGVLRAAWIWPLAFTMPGLAGLLLVMMAQTATVTAMGVFNPLLFARRLRRPASGDVARVLLAWTVTTRLVTAVLVATWGLLAAMVGTRVAVGIAGIALLLTPALLPWNRSASTMEDR
ncbi:MFS transporter [Pseudonocardia sp. CA-107938]|uniref:MFS transporter n=1 Tax=Pseudonocardia sp. CA-107938 TaxID=3240021 RepID=UPI003D8E7ABA